MSDYLQGFTGRLVAFALKAADFTAPFVDVAVRLWVAAIFWNSGLTKIANWETTVLLFQDEYKIQENLVLISNETAACLATAIELIAPVLLTIGLGARLASIPLIVMTAVIEFTYQMHSEHMYWFLLLGLVLSHGPGRFSWDYLIRHTLMEDVGKPGRYTLYASWAVSAALTLFALYHVTGLLRAV